ncbi:hypothetical protein ACFL6K_01820 [Candidatus Latescibacterota bacterium]
MTARKSGIDSYTVWLGYVTPGDLQFVKKFPVYPDRVYGVIAAYTLSIYYDENVDIKEFTNYVEKNTR